MKSLHILKYLLSAVFVTGLVSAAYTYANSQAPAGAQPSKTAVKNLKSAEKLLPTPEKNSEAKKLIAEALKDSLLALSPKVHYVAGRVDNNIYNEYYKQLSINRNDPKVDRVAMADALMDARQHYKMALSRDTVIDEKGRAHTKYSAEIVEWLNNSIPQYYNSGIAYLNKKQYFPKAYDAFMAYASAPIEPYYSGKHAVTDSARANAYFYAGVMAYNDAKYALSADAFEKARELHYPKKEVLLNEMICYRKIAQSDSSKMPEAMRKITDIAEEGVSRFGAKPEMFIQKYVAGKIWESKPEDALTVLDKLICENDSNYLLLSLRGNVNLVMDKKSEGLADYRMAASMPNADFATLLAASKALAKQGIEEIGLIEGNGKSSRKKHKEISDKYLTPALEYAERAKAIYADKEKGSDTITSTEVADLDNTISTITYYLIK